MFHCTRGKERTDFSNYRGISKVNIVEQIYAGILVDRVHVVTGGLTDDEQGGFRGSRVCVCV